MSFGCGGGGGGQNFMEAKDRQNQLRKKICNFLQGEGSKFQPKQDVKKITECLASDFFSILNTIMKLGESAPGVTWARASFMTDQLGTLQALSSTRWGLVFPLEVAYSSSRSHWFSSLQHLQKHAYIHVAICYGGGGDDSIANQNICAWFFLLNTQIPFKQLFTTLTQNYGTASLEIAMHVCC